MSDSILSDQLWQCIEPLLPKAKKRRNIQHAGRKPTAARKVMTGIIFVLKTGVPWKSLPPTSDFPSGHTCRRRLLEWDRRGVWTRLWQSILAELQSEGQLSSERGVVDSSSVRAGHGGEKTGKNPVDRAKLGSKHHLLVEGRGIPLSMSLTGANRHDITQLLTLIESIARVRGKRGRPRQKPKKLQGDRAYDSEPHRRALRKRGSSLSEPSDILHMAAGWAKRGG
jgi:transposase